MSTPICVVVTTIGDGNFLESYAAAVFREELVQDVHFIVIPDRKSPGELFRNAEEARRRGLRISCPSLEEQDAYLESLGSLRALIPYNSDNRRNIGFLMALEQECEILISVDDDNLPRPAQPFFGEHAVVDTYVEMEEVTSSNGWFNICELLGIEPPRVYARGFPYRHRHQRPELTFRMAEAAVHINAGLWLGNPDVDAVTALAIPARAVSYDSRSLLLSGNTWSPINTQNTAIAAVAIPAFYFARMGYPAVGMPIDRYGDIFSGYFAQACVRHLGYRVRVGTPATDHVRNSHNYLKDLTYELGCIWMLEDITEWLREARLQGSSYSEAYLCLAEMIEDAVERFSGPVWDDLARGYIHYLAYCMRAWLKAVNAIGVPIAKAPVASRSAETIRID